MNMEAVHMSCEIADRELDELIQKVKDSKSISRGDIETIKDLLKIIYYAKTTTAMEDAGYSRNYAYDDGYSNRRDSMGRYARDNGESAGRYTHANNGDRDHIIHGLDNMISSVKDDHMRKILEKARQEM